MIGNTIDNVERFLDVNIMVGFYQVIENCTSAGISHLTLTQPNGVVHNMTFMSTHTNETFFLHVKHVKFMRNLLLAANA